MMPLTMRQLLRTLYSTTYYFLNQIPDLDAYIQNRVRLASYDLDGVTIKRAEAADFQQLATTVDKFSESSRIAERTGRGDVCVVAYQHGKLAHVRWVTFKPKTSWGGHRMHLAPHEAYSYDSYTVPTFRQQGISSEARVFSLRYLAQQGIRCVYADTRTDNIHMQQTQLKRVREGRIRILGVVIVNTRLGRTGCTFTADTEATRPLLARLFHIPLHTIRIRSINKFLLEE